MDAQTFTRTAHRQPGYLFLTKKEVGEYSLGELIRSAAVSDTKALERYASASRAIGVMTGQQPQTISSYFVPPDFMLRDLTVANAGAGGYLVGTEAGFGPGLLNTTLIGTLPLRHQPLQGNLSAAVIDSMATQWQSTEATQATNASPTVSPRASTPKVLLSVNMASGQFHHQVGSAGMLAVEQQLGRKMGEAASTALINGAGAAGEPLGLLNMAGSVSVAGATLGWTGVRDMIAAAEGYGVGGLMFVAGVTTAKVLRAREKAAGSGMVFVDGGSTPRRITPPGANAKKRSSVRRKCCTLGSPSCRRTSLSASARTTSTRTLHGSLVG